MLAAHKAAQTIPSTHAPAVRPVANDTPMTGQVHPRNHPRPLSKHTNPTHQPPTRSTQPERGPPRTSFLALKKGVETDHHHAGPFIDPKQSKDLNLKRPVQQRELARAPVGDVEGMPEGQRLTFENLNVVAGGGQSDRLQ